METSPRIEVLRRDTTLVFAGPLTFATATQAIDLALPLLPAAEAIDLAGVTQGDSAGLAVLIECLKRAPGKRLALREAPPQLRALAAASGLASIFEPAR